MKLKTNELEGTALDWAVAKCEGFEYEASSGLLIKNMEPHFFRPYSTKWEHGGPIIEREGISVRLWIDQGWCATNECEGDECDGDDYVGVSGPTSLVAAMRCYVASKLGYEVDAPDELLGEQA